MKHLLAAVTTVRQRCLSSLLTNWMSLPRLGSGCHRWFWSAFWSFPLGRWHKDHWNQFYPWLVNPGHTVLGRGKQGQSRSASVCVCLDASELIWHSALLPHKRQPISFYGQTHLTCAVTSDFHANSDGRLQSNRPNWTWRPLSPVMQILADHLEVPSSTLCLICFIWVPWVGLGTENTSWMSSKISGLFLSRIFIRSFRTMMMFWVLSSAPCLELFSAAPG